VKLELTRVEVPAPGAQDAQRRWPTRSSLLVRLLDEHGAGGTGEASPLPGYSPDALPEVEQALAALDTGALANALAGGTVRAALAAVSGLVPRTLPSARAALETAALDLLARRRGTPAPLALGAEPSARRPLSALLGPATSPTLSSDAERALGQGDRSLKVKLGAPGALPAELAALTALRERFGFVFALRLDANGALHAPELADAAPALQRLNIELFEEPGVACLPELPLALDESLQGLTVAEAEAAWQRRGARALVLKPTALGGLSHCLALAERALASNLQLCVSHCFDGPFAWRAAAALALSLPAGAAHGLAPHAGLFGWKTGPLPLERGELLSWQEPGLGELSEPAAS
jgi:L-alanine-DL-glutamate epimerase-like enolase superfamily enzyme